MYAYLRKDDHNLIGLTAEADTTDNGDAALPQRRNGQRRVPEPRALFLCRGDALLAQTRKIIDDHEKPARELWQELAKIFKTHPMLKMC